jgi:peroxiredoxin
MDAGNSTRSTVMLLGGGLFVGLAIGAVVFFGLPALNPSTGSGRPTGSTPAPIAGSPAPDFSLEDTHGQALTLSSLKGKPVLINFWATWCVPCRVEMPAIEAVYQEHKDEGFTVLAVDADEPLREVTGFVNAFGLTFDILMDPGSTVNDLYRVRFYPSSFFIDRDGRVVALKIGEMTESELAEYLDAILGK